MIILGDSFSYLVLYFVIPIGYSEYSMLYGAKLSSYEQEGGIEGERKEVLSRQ